MTHRRDLSLLKFSFQCMGENGVTQKHLGNQ